MRHLIIPMALSFAILGTLGVGAAESPTITPNLTPDPPTLASAVVIIDAKGRIIGDPIPALLSDCIRAGIMTNADPSRPYYQACLPFVPGMLADKYIVPDEVPDVPGTP